jgi:hypothetical protein
MEKVDWLTASRFRAAAGVGAICASVLFLFSFLYLITSDYEWAAITFLSGIAFSLHARASAARCAAALSGYSLPPFAALKSWGGTFRILFPPKAMIFPPQN